MPNLAWTYNSLVAALQAWPSNSDTGYVADLDRIIGLGELRLVRDLNLEIFDREDTSITMTVGVRQVNKPANSVQIRSVGIIVNGEYFPLSQRSRDYCRLFAPSNATQGVPEYYAELSSTQIYVVLTPDSAYPVHYRYVARPLDSLNSGQPTATSWLSSNVPDALFAACLMEAEHYLKADDRYEDMKKKYYEELLPVARAELRQSIRRGDYNPFQRSASGA
jgi:hypothetical protein